MKIPSIEYNALPILLKLANNKLSDPYWYAFHKQTHFEFGVLSLQPGQKDVQHPHNSDEVYYILRGDGFLNINGEDLTVEKEKIFYVTKGTTHFFHGNSKHIEAFYVLN